MNPTSHSAEPHIDAFQQPREKLGFLFLLILIYLWVEYARPADPMGIPMVISIILFIGWLTGPKKIWSPQIICFFLLLCVIAVMGPFALNTFDIWFGFRAMAVQLLCISIPIVHFVNSSRKASIFIDCLIAIFAYLAVFGILHGGRGPGGPVGDENDVALALTVALPYAFVSIFLARSAARKIVYGSAFGLMTLGVMFTFSRGGFLGLISVLAYLFFLLPRKIPAVALGILLAIGAWMYAPEGYWDEMATISQDASNTETGTGALRREYWAVATRMFADNPIFGVGISNYKWNVSRYQSAEQYEYAGRSYAGNVAHSLYFTLLAEVGLAGTVIFALIAWMNFKDIRTIRRSARNALLALTTVSVSSQTAQEDAFGHDIQKLLYYGHALRASFLGYLVSSVFLTTFAYPHFWVLTALTLALKEITQATVSDLPSAVPSHQTT
jgi:O-antigen ligase